MSLHEDRWLTVKEAALRLDVSEGTIRRYIRRDGLAVRLGRIRESELLHAEAAARGRMIAGQKIGYQGPSRLRRVADSFIESHGVGHDAAKIIEQFVDFADKPGMYRPA